MAHSFYPVAVRIQHECREVVGMILRAKAWFAIAAPPAKEGGRMKSSHRLSIWRAKADVHAA